MCHMTPLVQLTLQRCDTFISEIVDVYLLLMDIKTRGCVKEQTACFWNIDLCLEYKNTPHFYSWEKVLHFH
jgi:hypothetical protein